MKKVNDYSSVVNLFGTVMCFVGDALDQGPLVHALREDTGHFVGLRNFASYYDANYDVTSIEACASYNSPSPIPVKLASAEFRKMGFQIGATLRSGIRIPHLTDAINDTSLGQGSIDVAKMQGRPMLFSGPSTMLVDKTTFSLDLTISLPTLIKNILKGTDDVDTVVGLILSTHPVLGYERSYVTTGDLIRGKNVEAIITAFNMNYLAVDPSSLKITKVRCALGELTRAFGDLKAEEQDLFANPPVSKAGSASLSSYDDNFVNVARINKANGVRDEKFSRASSQRGSQKDYSRSKGKGSYSSSRSSSRSDFKKESDSVILSTGNVEFPDSSMGYSSEGKSSSTAPASKYTSTNKAKAGNRKPNAGKYSGTDDVSSDMADKSSLPSTDTTKSVKDEWKSYKGKKTTNRLKDKENYKKG
jgi:hypothetical protein